MKYVRIQYNLPETAAEKIKQAGARLGVSNSVIVTLLADYAHAIQSHEINRLPLEPRNRMGDGRRDRKKPTKEK